MPKVTKIAENKALAPKTARLRVAAYCRVSTDHEDQLDSLDAQKSHYILYIRANPQWELAGIYIDEGISGTKKDRRVGLQNLLVDCESRKIDFIVTKSISRLARNTTDCLEIVRRLTSLGIHIYFEKESINTGTMDGELMLTILSSLAEQESFSFSQNNRWSVKRQFQNGTYRQSRPPYGYAMVDGKLVVHPEQADIVGRIFREALSGWGSEAIARGLNEDGVQPCRGSQWRSSAVLWILKNEVYCGDVRLQKTFTDDNFIRHINYGQKDQYLISNHHEPIITCEDFDAVSEALFQRGREKGVVKDTCKYLNRYPFSSKIRCGECGGTFKRRIHSNAGKAYIAWCCSNHLSDNTRCSMLFIREDAIKRAFVIVMNKLISGDGEVLEPLRQLLKEFDRENGAALREMDAQLKDNAERSQVLTGLFAKGYLDAALYAKQNNELRTEATALKEQRAVLAGAVNTHAQADTLLRYATKAEALLDIFDGELFERSVDAITVFSPTEIGFRMKCGIMLREKVERKSCKKETNE